MNTKPAATLPRLAFTVIDGKYDGVSYEYAPMAWIHPEGHGPDLQKERGAPDRNLKLLASARITAIHYLGDPAENARLQAAEVATVAAIVHRANAYPKLVEALRAAQRGEQWNGHLLHELGESTT